MHGFILESCAQYSSTIKHPEASKDIQKPQLKELPDTVGITAKMVFDSISYHFGEIKEGEIIEKLIFLPMKDLGI